MPQLRIYDKRNERKVCRTSDLSILRRLARQAIAQRVLIACASFRSGTLVFAKRGREKTRLRFVGEREIVRSLGDSRFLLRVRFLNLRRHPIELRGERGKLIIGVYSDSTVEVSLTKLSCTCFDFADGSHHSPRKQ